MNENQVQVPVTENDSDAVIVDPLDQETLARAGKERKRRKGLFAETTRRLKETGRR